MKRLFCLAIFMLSISSLFAEADNGKFFSDPATPASAENIFIEISGNFATPIGFLQKQAMPMTGVGGGLSAGFGYNWDGWLFGLRYTWDTLTKGYTDAALMEKFYNHILEFRLQRVLNKNSFENFPDWLAIVPGFGIGVDFLGADYYPSESAKAAKDLKTVKPLDKGATTFLADLSFEVSFYPLGDALIPFLGTSYNLFGDTSLGGGLAGFFRFYAGIRTYPGAIGKTIAEAKAKKAAASENISTDAAATLGLNLVEGFSPDGDGLNDVMLLSPRTANLAYAPESWKLEIQTPRGVTIREWEGKGKIPSQIKWKGDVYEDEDLFSRNDYVAKLTVVPNQKDQERTGKTLLTTSEKFKTGIIMQVIIPKIKWKIVVNTIFFDPNKATFNEISAEQIRSNEDTINSIAKQLLANKHRLKVQVEGYANNTSNTYEEHINDLLPLSDQRAKAIMNMLIDKGLDPNLLSSVGRGGENPIAKWEDTENWWKNRRVEFIVTR